jgi:hypothetical protein
MAKTTERTQSQLFEEAIVKEFEIRPELVDLQKSLIEAIKSKSNIAPVLTEIVSRTKSLGLEFNAQSAQIIGVLSSAFDNCSVHDVSANGSNFNLKRDMIPFVSLIAEPNFVLQEILVGKKQIKTAIQEARHQMLKENKASQTIIIESSQARNTSELGTKTCNSSLINGKLESISNVDYMSEQYGKFLHEVSGRIQTRDAVTNGLWSGIKFNRGEKGEQHFASSEKLRGFTKNDGEKPIENAILFGTKLVVANAISGNSCINEIVEFWKLDIPDYARGHIRSELQKIINTTKFSQVRQNANQCLDKLVSLSEFEISDKPSFGQRLVRLAKRGV